MSIARRLLHEGVSNAENTGEFVLNMPTYDLREAVALTASISDSDMLDASVAKGTACIDDTHVPRGPPIPQAFLDQGTL